MVDYPLTGQIASPAVLADAIAMAISQSGQIASPAVLTGVGVIIYVVPEGIQSPAVLGGTVGGVALGMTGQIGSPGVLSPDPYAAYHMLGFIHSPAVLRGSFGGPAVLTGQIAALVMLGGNFVIVRGPSSSREAMYEATGYRATFGLLVYAINCKIMLDIADVPIGGSFLVSHAFTAGPGDPFFDAGALADDIGTIAQSPTGETYLVFRAPTPNEAVWFVNDPEAPL